MRFRLYGGAVILPHLPHHGACRALSATGCAPLRRSSPSDPLVPWERRVLSRNTGVYRSCTGPNTRLRFQGLGGLQSATQKRRKAIHPGEILQLVSYGWSGLSCPLVDRERLFQDSSGATRLHGQGAAAGLHAQGHEHPRVSALMRRSAENPLPGSRFPGEPKRTDERQATHGP